MYHNAIADKIHFKNVKKQKIPVFVWLNKLDGATNKFVKKLVDLFFFFFFFWRLSLSGKLIEQYPKFEIGMISFPLESHNLPHFISTQWRLVRLLG